MPDAPQVAIHRLIVHKVDNRNYDQPQLSDLESPIPDDVASFLRRHIVNNRQHKHTRTAVFTSPPAGQPALRYMADALLADPGQFVAQSREISEHLFHALDQRTSPGDLAVCTFSDGQPDAPQWLALLKMDPEDGFVGERVEQNGMATVVLRRVPNVMPTGNLQKCAFVLPPVLRPELKYDLKVLDQQTAGFGVDRMVASYFTLRFLQCRVGLNAADKTFAFIYRSHEWLAHRARDWQPEDVERLKASLRISAQSPVIDLVAFAQSQIADPGQQMDYLAYVARNLDELSFETDQAAREKLGRYRSFEGDHGLQVRIETDEVGPGKTLEWVAEPGSNRTIVTIRTVLWREQKPGGR